MRTYPRNSPEAAGRLLALVLIADGNVCRSEFEALETANACRRLGLAPEAMPRLVLDLCEDLMSGMCATGDLATHLDDGALAALMREVDDPRLQGEVLALARSAAAADRHLAEGETLVIEAAKRHWKLQSEADAAALHVA